MILAKKQLFSLTVITVKGVHIGRVVDVGLDSISQSIVTYYVRPFWQWRKSLGIGMIVSSPLCIQRAQVVRVTSDELIVEDAIISIKSEQPVPRVRISDRVSEGAQTRAPVV